jgi:hypothetical protein
MWTLSVVQCGRVPRALRCTYALADWNKIPLNPTLFAEYRIGIGPLNETAEVGSQPKGDEDDQGPGRTPNAYELRLLLAEDWGDNDAWVGLAQQRYVKSHRIIANSLGVKDLR